jgi:glutamate synthase domain-containing protein 2
MADCVDPAGAAGHLGSAAKAACHSAQLSRHGAFALHLRIHPPEIRQYFIEGDTEAQPFSRAQRSLVYQRAKGQVDNRPFGTQLDVSQQGYEWVNHSLQPTKLSSHDFRLWIGGTQEQPAEGVDPCTRPYHASVFNISAMSFGALSGNAIQALNQGAKMGGFIHDTGEGSISQYHRMHGGDLIWEVASGYFGCRNADGTFSEENSSPTPPIRRSR